jgi:microcystin-dependent protein
MVGTENNTILISNLPPHNHMPAVINCQLPVNADTANTDSPDGAFPGPAPTNVYAGVPGTNQATGNFHTVPTIGPAGQTTPMNNLQPFLGMNYIICMYGVFPYRN